MRAGTGWIALSVLLTVVMLLPAPVQAQRDASTPINYRHLATVGGEGDWGYDLKAPYDIAVDPDGFMYVTDLASRSLVKIAPDYRFVTATQSKALPNTVVAFGTKTGLQAPMGVSVHGGRVYVADGDDVVAYGTDMFFLQRFGSLSEQMGWGCGLEVTTGFFSPDAIYLADIGLHRVYKYELPDPSSGVLTIEVPGYEVPHWGTYGRGAGEFRSPCAIAAVPDGSGIYVLDRDNHRVVRSSVDGGSTKAWGRHGAGPGDFRRPEGIATGPDGSVYVADTDNHRIQRFTAGGDFIQQWGERGGVGEPMGLRAPRGITVDGQGRVYVCDTEHGVVKIYGLRPVVRPEIIRIQRP